MPSVAHLVEPETLQRLATPSNLRLGREIVERDGVRLEAFGPLRVSAKVGGSPATGQRRTVELVSDTSGLRWTCSCFRRADLFCKHCVAAALVAWREAP